MLNDIQVEFISTNYKEMTAVEISEALTEMGYPLKEYKVRYHLSKIGLHPKWIKKKCNWKGPALDYLKSSYTNEDPDVIISNLRKLGVDRTWKQIRQYANFVGVKRDSNLIGNAIRDGRRKTLDRASRRLSIGLDPQINITNFGNPMPKYLMKLRYWMIKRYKYIILYGDQNIYFDESTTRRIHLEKKYMEYGRYVVQYNDKYGKQS